MQIPSVLALSLEEAKQRLETAGIAYTVETLLPPRDNEADFAEQKVRKYVVRQQMQPDDILKITIVYRI